MIFIIRRQFRFIYQLQINLNWEKLSQPISRVLSRIIIHLDYRVTSSLKRPTRKQRGQRHSFPIWSCSEWGLPCHFCYQKRGALLPHPFTLTSHGPKIKTGGLLSVALAVGSRLPDVIWHSVLWSPDFPPAPIP